MSVSDLVSKGYYGYQGWGDAAADADFKATGGSGKGGQSSSSSSSSSNFSVPDPVETAKKLRDFNIQSNQPGIQSLQGQIPEIQKTFDTTKSNLEAQRKPLEDRYQTLLSSIKGNQDQSINRQTTATSNELGRRGIQGGGLYDQTFTDALNPINQQYAGLYGQANASHEQDLGGLNTLLSQLPNQQTDAMRQVQNAIAQLQAGDPSSSIQGALQYGGQVTSAAQAQAQQEMARQQQSFQQQQASIANALAQSQQSLAERQFNQISLPQSQYALNKPYYKADSSSNLPDLNSIFGG